MTVEAFPLAHSKRVLSVARQVMGCRYEKRRDRLAALVDAERDKLIKYGITDDVAEREATALRDRVAFIIAARPIMETSA